MGESSQANEDGSSVIQVHSQASTPEAGNLEHPDERGVEIPGQQPVQNGLEQGVERSNNHVPQDDDNGDISRYTAALKEHGDQIGVIPAYDYKPISLEPTLFRATLVFQQINVTGDGKTKKLARHRASKEACIQLGLSPL
jgi:hypothetical protein